MTDLTGSTLGQYHIQRMIGHGGMADVYLADQISIGRQVAIKVLPAHFLQDRSFLQRFMQEVKVIAGLQHPHILPVYDFGEHEGLPYIVMAYLTGGSLADRIHQTGGLSVAEATQFLQQIASGLGYAHKKGIIHRDFKPSNVLLDEQENAYLADFGIAKITESTAQLTGSGMVGTPAYMAPEMSQPNGVSPLVDVYALGVTLYQMLTGRQPYEADTPMGIMIAHVTQPIPDVRQVRPDLPDAVQIVIEGAMAKDPVDRYQSPGEVAKAFAAAASGQAISAPKPRPTRDEATLVEDRMVDDDGATLPEFHTPPQPPAPTPKVEKAPRKRTSWLLPAIVGLLALVACAVVGILVVPGLLSQMGGGASSAIPETSPSTVMPSAAAELPTPLPPTPEQGNETPIVPGIQTGAIPAECSDARACVVIAPGDPIKIGFAGPMSGGTSNFGIDLSRASLLALEDAGSLGDHPFMLVIEDDTGTPEGGAQAATKFVSSGDIAAVVGHIFSGASNAAIPIYEDALIPMMSPSSTNQSLTTLSSDVFNRVAYNDLYQGRSAAGFVYSNLGISRLAVLHDGSPYGQALAETTRDAFSALGGTITTFEAIPGGQTDYSGVLASVAAGSPGAIYFGGYDADAGHLVSGLPAAGLSEAAFIGGESLYVQSYLDIAGSHAEGTYTVSLGIPPDSAAKSAFDQRFEDAYGTQPGVMTSYTWNSYDAASVLVDAIRRVAVETPDGTLYIPRSALVDAVRSTSEFPGIAGMITCSPVGECAAEDPAVYVVQNGTFVPAH